MPTNLDLYTDYLLSCFGSTTATGLSRLTDQAISHDDVTRFLTELTGGSKSLWHQVKKFVRQVESKEGVLAIDDTIIEKAHSDENGLISIHYDHSKDRYVKGINLVSAVYGVADIQIPVSYEAVVKTLRSEMKTRQAIWKSDRTKNEVFRDLVKTAHLNQVLFKYVLSDSWYTNADNIKHVLALNKHLIGAVKSNLEVALSKADKRAGKFQKISQLNLQLGALVVYLRSVDTPLLLCKDIFVNVDGSEGILYVVSTDTSLTFQQTLASYQKRWGVGEYHKALKNNASIQKSPTKSMPTQANHLFASLCAYVKLERLKVLEKTNQFALKQRLYLKAIPAAFKELNSLKINLA